MKHTSSYDKIAEIRQQEIAELKEAIKAHGGKFCWGENVGKPIVAANPDGCTPNPIDVEIISVHTDADNRLIIYGVDKCGWEEREFLPEDIFVEHLSFITDYIPETETVSDVSQKQEFFKITSVSRDDLEARGFDTESIDDSNMSTLARKMGDDYCTQLFWDSMEIIAEILGFPRKWDKWFKECDFATMEKITGYKQSDFSSDDGYQDFVDACEAWWDKLNTEDRKEIYCTSNPENDY